MKNQNTTGLGVSEFRKLRQLEEENAQLNKLVAYLSLDKQILQDVLKKVLSSSQRRKITSELISYTSSKYIGHLSSNSLKRY